MRSSALIPSILALLLVPTVAFARPNVALKLSGAVVTKAADGHVVATPVEQSSLKPGDTVLWTVDARNTGDKPASALKLAEKISPTTAYVENSAKAPNSHVEFSLDNGKTWSAAPTVTVKDADGKPVVKKAPASSFTAIRFVADGALAPRGQTDYTYEVRVK